jgi:predicted alpha/beta superfamily hydrolase
LKKILNMRLLSVFIATVLCTLSTSAQLTIQITSLPANTPAGDTCYFAGSSNNWNPMDAQAIFAEGANQMRSYTFTPPVGTVQYKITRGSWASVEGTASGTFIPNRTVSYQGSPKTVQISVAGWEDLGSSGGGPTSTAAANVTVLNPAFQIPQLNRTRRVWLYLPPDYQTALTKRYPVLYLLDGQNVFDATTSFVGEWQVDEALNARFASGDAGCIAVAIDHGGAQRINEYSPWINPQYGGGEGDEFLAFLTETLKPYIDAQYRTNPAPSHTAIGGSSMGGIFAQYAQTERQDVFGKALVFSPAFWFAGSASRDQVIQVGKQGDARVFYLSGGAEPSYVSQDMAAVRNAMMQVGHPVSELYTSTPPDGAHSEWFWRREFPGAYTWLFQNLSSDTQQAELTKKWRIYPNPAQDILTIKTPRSATVDVIVYSSNGQKVLEVNDLASGAKLQIGHLPKGSYYAHLIGERFKTVRSFIKQ